MKSMQKPPAVSLIFAIILITVLLATGATMSASFLKASQRNSDLFRSTQAYYAARASIEKAIAAVAAKGVGYENSATNAISWDTTNDTVIDTTGEYKIFAQSKPLDWQSTTPSICGQNMIQCFIPMPGTGSAGENCNFEDPNQTLWYNIYIYNATFTRDIVDKTLIHEIEHWANDVSSWFGNSNPDLSEYKEIVSIYNDSIKNPLMALHGYYGYMSQIILYGKL